MEPGSRFFDPSVDYYTPRIRQHYSIPLHDDDLDMEIASADIGWAPDAAKFEQRQRVRRNEVGETATTLPAGWPPKLNHPLAWRGSELAPGDYIFEVKAGEIAEIEAALSQCKGKSPSSPLRSPQVARYIDYLTLSITGTSLAGPNLDLNDVRMSTFPLPTLGPRLDELRRRIYNGNGFCLIRGLNPKSYSREDNVIIYLGISSYFGQERGRQYQNGRLMCTC
jgi:hypothetical protein